MLLAHWNNLSLLFLLSAVFLAESQYDLNEQLILTMMSTIIMHFGLLKLDILLFINLFCLENKVKKRNLPNPALLHVRLVHRAPCSVHIQVLQLSAVVTFSLTRYIVVLTL